VEVKVSIFERLRARRVGGYIAVAVIVGAAAGGGWALAAGGSRIHACANKKNGSLRLAGRCQSTEKAVTWNVKGPQGPQGVKGLRGPAGTNGIAGAAGPSNAFSGSIVGPITITSSTTPGDKVGHLNLAAGSYVILAKAWLENQSGTINTTAGCELDLGSQSDSDTLKLTATSGGAFRGAVALNLNATLSSPATAQLSCSTGGGVIVTANDIVMTAIHVGSLNANALVAG
jgi:hypothetical protein